MQSRATTVDQYLAELPEDRRAVIAAVRKLVLRNLDKNYEEGMQYGMIGYYVPHRVYPAGYHCDPRQPLPFAGLASQKNHMSLYLMAVYFRDEAWFREQWAKTGKKLDMGKSCIRFRKLEDLALDVIGEAIARVPVPRYIEYYEAGLKATSTRSGTKGKSETKGKKATTARPKKSGSGGRSSQVANSAPKGSSAKRSPPSRATVKKSARKK